MYIPYSDVRFAVCGFFVAVAVAVAGAVAVQMRKKRKPQQALQMHQNRKPQTAKPSCGFVAVLFAVAVVGRILSCGFNFAVAVAVAVRQNAPHIGSANEKVKHQKEPPKPPQN